MELSIKKAAVIGAGVMGSGIAAQIAGAGIPVVLLDIVLPELNEDEKKKGIQKDDPAHMNLLAKVGKDRVADPKTGDLYLPEMADYITVGNLDTDLELLKDCDWIVEVVAEKLEIKHNLFRKIAPYINKDAIVSTNTSGIPVGSIATCMEPDLQRRFLGTHFFNPPRYMRLFEVIPTENTAPEITDAIRKFGQIILGKGIVDAKDTPNFIGNRIGAASFPVTLKLMDKYGFDVEMVDYLTGPLIGRPRTATFKTQDLVGLDITLHVMDNLSTTLEDKEEVAWFSLPDYVRKMKENGQLGNKTGSGFYKRFKDANGKKSALIWDPKKEEYIPSKKVSVEFIEETKKKRRLKDRLNTLLYSEEPEGKFLWELISSALVYSAKKVPEIADDYQEIDKAMRWGYNWEVGPFEIWDLIGFEKAADKMKADGAKLPNWIEERLAAKKPFYPNDADILSFSTVYPMIKELGHSNLLDMGDGVLALDIHSPGNCITEKLRNDIAEALDIVENERTYKGLVLLNANANFLTGADIKTMIGHLETYNYSAIEQGVADFQSVSLRLKYAKKPVVAAIHGMVLGGGLEYSIHCSRIVAHIDTYMGLVEAGVGIIPGGGGVKEMLMRGIADITAYNYADHHPVVAKYWQQIATAEVSKNAFVAKKMGYLLPTDKIVAQIDLLPQRSKDEVLLMVKEGYRQKLPAMTKVPGVDGRAYLEQIINAMRSGCYISDYDAIIAMEVAKAITGGDVPKGTLLTEQELLRLEQVGLVTLIQNQKTHERVMAMAITGKPLRN